MNPKTINIRNPKQLSIAAGTIAYNWRVNYLAENDRYYAYVLTETLQTITMQIFKKTKLMYNPYNFIPDHHIEILFEIPHSKKVTKTMELGKFRHVSSVLMCVMDGVNEVNQS